MILLSPFPHYYLVALAPLSFAIKTDRKKKKKMVIFYPKTTSSRNWNPGMFFR